MKTREPAEEGPEKDQSQSQLCPGGVHVSGEAGVHWAEKTQQQDVSSLWERRRPQRGLGQGMHYNLERKQELRFWCGNNILSMTYCFLVVSKRSNEGHSGTGSRAGDTISHPNHPIGNLVWSQAKSMLLYLSR